jgi:hypothetical protein
VRRTKKYTGVDLKNPLVDRDIRKVRKGQHEYPEFGHTQGE